MVLINDIHRFAGMAVSRLFVDPTFHNNKVRKVMEMWENIREAFASLVVRIDWMDQSTKTATLEKNRKMGSEIGFPEWLFDEKKLNEYYEGVRFAKDLCNNYISYKSVTNNRICINAIEKEHVNEILFCAENAYEKSVCFFILLCSLLKFYSVYLFFYLFYLTRKIFDKNFINSYSRSRF